MWHNPRLLNAAANLLTGLAALMFAYAGLQLLLRSPLFPLSEIVVRGELKNAEAAAIRNALNDIGGNFFAADLASVRARLEPLAWVRQVRLRRVWPDRIEVQLEEHVAFARWGDSALVNTFGESFSAPIDEASAAQLPLFAGPAGSEREMLRRCRRFVELLAPLGETADRVVLTPRHAWQLHLASGLYLELGRDGADPVEERLARFVAAYPASLARLPLAAADEPRFVDLRYPNGFALRVAGWQG